MPDKPATLNAYLKQFRENTRGTADELTQEGIAQKIGESQSQVSKIERGMVRLHTWRPERLYQLLLAWRQTPSMMLQLADRFDLTALREYIAETRHMASVSEGSRVRYLGVVSAGKLGANEVLENGHASVSVPDAIAERYRLEDVFAVNVVGDSMLDEDARRSIPPGSLVYFHSKLAPEIGEIVCVYLPHYDQTVIKKWKPQAGYAVLASSNPQHEPIIVRDADEALLQGVYLTHIPETSRLR